MPFWQCTVVSRCLCWCRTSSQLKYAFLTVCCCVQVPLLMPNRFTIEICLFNSVLLLCPGASADAEPVRCTQHPHGGTRGARQCRQHANQEGGERRRTHGRRAHCASHCCRMRQGIQYTLGCSDFNNLIWATNLWLPNSILSHVIKKGFPLFWALHIAVECGKVHAHAQQQIDKNAILDRQLLFFWLAPFLPKILLLCVFV